MRDYKKYKAWDKAHQLAKLIYRDTMTFPKSEQFGLVSQLRRAAFSAASAAEVEYLCQLSHELDFIDLQKSKLLIEQANHIRRMIYNLIKSFK